MLEQIFDDETLALLKRDIDPQLVSGRKQNGRNVSYIEGHTAIDQANRIFGYGNWSFNTLSCEMKVILDPLTNEAMGVCYEARVELLVRGAVGPIVEVGSHPVAAWSVDEVVSGRRNDGDDIETRPITLAERISARRTIVDAHENGRKSSVTDGMKRCLRAYGNQFANSLYGKGQIVLLEDLQTRAETLCPGKWEAIKAKVLGGNVPDDRLVPEQCKRISKSLDSLEQKRKLKNAEPAEQSA